MVSLRKKNSCISKKCWKGVLAFKNVVECCSGAFWLNSSTAHTHTNNKYIISNIAHTPPAYCSQQHLDINNAYNSTQITTHKANERCAETFRLEFRTHPLPCRVGTWQQNRKKKIIYKFSIFRKQVRNIITTTLGTTSINCYHLQYSLP